MKVLAYGEWVESLGKIRTVGMKDVELVGVIGENKYSELYHIPLFNSANDYIEDIDLVCIDNEHTNKEILLELADKSGNVICEGLWRIRGYLEIIKEFKKRNKYVFESESFMSYPNIYSFINLGKQMIEKDCNAQIQVKLNFNYLYVAMRILQMIVPEISQLLITDCINTGYENFIFCKVKKRSIVFQVNKRVFSGLGRKYSSEGIKVRLNTNRGNLVLNEFTGQLSLEALHPCLEYEKNFHMKGYLFEPIIKNIENKDINYEMFFNREKLVSKCYEVYKIKNYNHNKENFISRMQHQIICIECCNKVSKNIDSSGDKTEECQPISSVLINKFKVDDPIDKELIVDDIFKDYSPEYIEYSIAQRNKIIVLTILRYMNDNKLLYRDIPCTMDDIFEKLKVHDDNKSIIIKWLKLLIDNGYISEIQNGIFLANKTISEDEIKLRWKEVEYLWSNKLESYLVLEYLQKNIQNWSNLIQKKQSANLLLFEYGQDDYAEALYKETKILLYENKLLSECLIKQIEKKNEDIVILEIGAGTGATTDIILNDFKKIKMERKITYYYTDISKYFLKRAKERYKDCKIKNIDMRYNILNIDKPFENQLSNSVKADVIIAVGVLNNSQNTDKCIDEINKVLIKGGALFIVETIEDVPDILISQSFMMSKPEDCRHRKKTTFLTKDDWMNVLRDNGFKIIGEFPQQGNYLEKLSQKLLYAIKE